MKICALILNSNLIECDEQSGVLNFIKTKLYEIGENISLISYFDNNLEKLRNIFYDGYDMIFCVGNNSSIYNHNIKDNLARIFGDKLTSFEATYSSLSKYCQKNNIVFSMQEEMEVLLPSKSIPLVDDNIPLNGFMYKHNNTYVMFLPPELEFVRNNYFSYILPLISDLVNIDKDYQVIKCFGLLEKDVRGMISEFIGNPSININIVSSDLDHTIFIRYNDNIDKSKLQEIVSGICIKLSKFIYATEDVSIYQMAIDLLNLRKKKLTIVETLTLGNITKSLCQIDNSVVDESFLFVNYETLKKNIAIDNKIVDNFGKYSVQTIYEYANKILEKSTSDIVMFLLGDNDNKELNYMAIGDINGIHVYKNKTIVNEKLIDNLSKTAVFYLIKNLKQNDLQF